MKIFMVHSQALLQRRREIFQNGVAQALKNLPNKNQTVNIFVSKFYYLKLRSYEKAVFLTM
jgi:hypothetical protein